MLLLNGIICHSLALVIGVAGSNSCLAASQKNRPVKEKKAVSKSLLSDTKQLQTDVKEFLHSWLVDHDFKKSLLFFSAQATSNEVMLHANCGGYIKEEQRKSQSAVQKGIEKFLRDFAAGAKGISLSKQLDVTRFTGNDSPKALNDVRQDRYLLVKLSVKDLGQLVDSSHVIESLRTKLRSEHFYFSMISVKGGILYFLWTQNADKWQVYHADMICI